MTRRIEREELYEAIWRDPATTVAARYGITSTALAKVCRKLDVPAPPRGYWARRAAGQTPRRPSLPRLKPDQPTAHRIAGGSLRELTITPQYVVDERSRPKVVVPDVAAPLHPLVQKYEARLRRRGDSPVDRAAVHAIDIDVSRAQLDRALRIMSAVLGALDERQLRVEVVHAEGAGACRTFVTIDGGRLAFGLREERTRVFVPIAATTAVPQMDPDAWRSMKNERARAEAYAISLLARRQPAPPAASAGPAYVTEQHEWSGRLTLWIDTLVHLPGAGPRNFTESDTRRIEDRLGTFVLRLRTLAAAVEEARARAETEARRRADEEARREEAERVRAAQVRARAREERLRNDVEHRAALFRRAQDIRSLLDVMQRDVGISTSVSSWITWAEGYANALERDAREPPAFWNES